MITPTFHLKILESFVEVFSQNSEILVRMLKKEVGSQGFDVYPYITLCALDILCGECLNKPAQSKVFCSFVGSYRQVAKDSVDSNNCPRDTAITI
jgi:hypothetical protein